jgi:hypothetical protein
VVERRCAFGHDEKKKFRALMRSYEKFSNCRVLACCLRSNPIPPLPPSGAAVTVDSKINPYHPCYLELGFPATCSVRCRARFVLARVAAAC